MKIIKKSVGIGASKAGEILNEQTAEMVAQKSGEELRLTIESAGHEWTIVLNKTERQRLEKLLISN